MKLIILRENLKNALSAVERSVGEGNNLPILKNIFFTAEEKHIRLTATNLEIAVTQIIPGKIEDAGGITVPFSVLYAIIAKAASERVRLETDKTTLRVLTDRYAAKLQGIASEEFPIIPRMDEKAHTFEIQGEVFRRAAQDVVSAAQFSEIRPEISGLLFDFQVSAIKLVATDSFRLAERVIPQSQFTARTERGMKCIIPLKTAHEAIRIFSGKEQLVISVDQSQISFRTEKGELISRLIDGQYPDYEQIIPKANDTEIVVDRGEFEQALALVGGFSGKASEVTLRLAESGKGIECYSANQYVGENAYQLEARIKGEKLSPVRFNARYLADGMKSILTPEVVLAVNGDARPALLKAPEDSSYRYLVMPVRSAV